MSHRRISKRRAVMAGAGVAALVITGVTFQSANASTTNSAQPTTLSVAKAGTLASSITSDLGKNAAGSYYDAKTKHLVVNVLSKDDAAAVESAGAEAKVVKNSLAALKSAKATVGTHHTAGTSWAIDPASNKLVVTADRTVTGAKLDKVTKVVKSLGDRAVLKHTKGEYKPFIAGGDSIQDPSIGRCSLGFNVTVGGKPAFITAGHCTAEITNWSDGDGNELGTTTESDFPDTDYGLVTYSSDTDHPSEVDLYNGSTQKITKAADATVGEKVQRSGSTTQVHDGTVKALDATVDYGNGDVVNGLIDTDVCAEPGDSGGSLFDGESAIGMTSGGSGDCSAGGETFFQPVPAALDALGAEIG